MNQKQIRAAVEAMLFASGDPIGADKLAQAVQLPQLSVEAALEALRERYAREDSGLCLLHLNTRWQLATKTEWADCVRRVLDSRRAVPLGPAAMETLTVIAYNQPVSRAFIEQVRGEDPAAAARDYGKLQAWLYPVLGVLDRFLWLQFDELRILPDFGSSQPTVEDRVSCRVSAQALFIVIAALRVLYEFWRKKVLDIFL